ncbi:MAG: phosphotransferase [Actinomycetota bacterium]|nr:phosphotransferase [Actinomycetota bacterium]
MDTAACIEREYGLSQSAVVAAGAGTEADVRRIERGAETPLCAKMFRHPVDVAATERVALMDQLRRSAGLPFPRLHRTRYGHPSTTIEGRPLVVLDWVSGSTLETLCRTYAEAAAATLAKLHTALARVSAPTVATRPSWETDGAANAIERCLGLRAEIACLEAPSPFDDVIAEALSERIDDLGIADDLLKLKVGG